MFVWQQAFFWRWLHRRRLRSPLSVPKAGSLGLIWLRQVCLPVAVPSTASIGPVPSPAPGKTLTNTSQTFVTNIQPFGAGSAFYRVTWTNGQVWSYAGYSGQSLVATGTLYVGVSRPSLCIIDGGVYDLAPGSPYRSGFGPLTPLACGLLDYDAIIVGRDARDDYFELDVITAENDTWNGNWSWEGFAESAHGTFVARTIIYGQ